ncbi:MAG: phosphatidylglycerophosphatase A [Candidatus Marinimicrobia bacterium]|nr:phosphatidylglycerophosphatase A [Candidatus Neomarinimicrobiota bacterium]
MKTSRSRWLSHTIGSFLGIGYFPLFPGTVASLVTAALAYVLALNFDIKLIWDIEIFFVLLLLGLLSGYDLVKHKDIKDPKWFVMDEAAGMWLSLIAIPKDNIWLVLIAFALFRVFDITKPWLISKAEKIPGATGIMFDDVLAAIPAWLITFAVWKLFF